jgi:energy-converting hydrogenase A subunit M
MANTFRLRVMTLPISYCSIEQPALMKQVDIFALELSWLVDILAYIMIERALIKQSELKSFIQELGLEADALR